MRVEREANMELLRVISMAMVIVLHCLGHGGVLSMYSFGEAGYFLFQQIRGFCFVAVNCFVLITGYFMISAEIKYSRVIKLIIQVEFYSVLCLLLTKYLFRQPVDAKDIFKVLFPITNNQYWFATHYMILLALMPLINKLVAAIDQKEHLYIIKILVTVFSVLPSFLFWCRSIVGYGVDFTWFIVLYIIAAYIRKYGSRISGRRCIVTWIIVCGVVTGGTICMELLLHKLGVAREGAGYGIFFFGYNSVVILGAAVLLFLGFSKMRLKSKFLVRLSGCGRYVFGAYLLSDHDVIRRALWEKVNFSGVNQSGGGTFAVAAYLAGIVLIILLTGCLVEYLRSRMNQWLILHAKSIFCGKCAKIF